MGSRGLRRRITTALVAALGAALTLSISAPADAAKKPKRPKRCAASHVTVVVKKKRTCLRPAALMKRAPAGADLPELLVRATADRTIWRGPRKGATGALGKNAPALLAFDVALVRASRAAGKPLVPREPTPPTQRKTSDDSETLGLDVSKTPIGWVQKQAERVESWKEKAGGIQERKAETKGRLMPASSAGEYGLEVAEEFTGDPCPKAGGVVDAAATYTVTRTVDGLFGKSIENVAKVRVDVKAKVGKKGVLLDYTLSASFFAEGGGWTASANTNKGAAKPGKILNPGDVASVDLTGKLDPKTSAKVAGAMYRAILMAKQKADLWLEEAQKVWLNKAACKKVTGDGLGTLRPGDEREIDVTIKSIRGASTDEEVELRGRNGLQVVSPTGKVTAKGGKLKVKVKAQSRRSLTGSAAAPYALDVEGLSELGRGVGSLPFKRVVGYRFSGLKYRAEVHDIVYGVSYSQYEVIDARFCGEDPYRELWKLKIQEDSDWPLFGHHVFHGTIDWSWIEGGLIIGGSSLGAEAHAQLVRGPEDVPTGVTMTVGYSEGHEPTGHQWDVHLFPLVTQATVEEDPTCMG